MTRASMPELLLEEQLKGAGIPYEREYEFAPAAWCIERGYVTQKRKLPKKWRADFHSEVYLGGHFYRLIIEVDGGTWTGGRHVTGSGFAEDAAKLNAAAELGYRVLRYTPSMIEDGSALAQIQRVLGL